MTQVANLEPLQGLTKLQELKLSMTQVANLEPLKGLPALHQLNLPGTQVTNSELGNFVDYRTQHGLPPVSVLRQ